MVCLLDRTDFVVLHLRLFSVHLFTLHSSPLAYVLLQLWLCLMLFLFFAVFQSCLCLYSCLRMTFAWTSPFFLITKVIRLIFFSKSGNPHGPQVSLTDLDMFDVEGRTCWFCFKGMEVHPRPKQHWAIEKQHNHHLNANQNLLTHLSAAWKSRPTASSSLHMYNKIVFRKFGIRAKYFCGH